MSLHLELEIYVQELESINAECQRPREGGAPCPQCDEREIIILRLREILNKR